MDKNGEEHPMPNCPCNKCREELPRATTHAEWEYDYLNPDEGNPLSNPPRTDEQITETDNTVMAQRYNPNWIEDSNIQASEPMDIAMRLLKHAESPAAKKHKHDYDTKYESSPERRKYRTELTQERRKRHVDGKGGKDMSHTAQGTIVPEDMHANRARHFKERGTLKKTVAVVSYSEPIGKRV